MTPTTHQTEHRSTVDAPAEVVHDLVADVSRWPLIFPPTVHAEHEQLAPGRERIHLWATANEAPKAWTSLRELDREGLRVHFRQEQSAPPVAAMGGCWIVEPLGKQRCLVRLTHDFAASGDDAANLEWISRAVHDNSERELAALRSAAERHHEFADLTMTFVDSIRIRGRAADVYEFIARADQWEQRLPHVARVDMAEHPGNLQVLEMDTRTADGSAHTTRSVRVCFPADRIAYKQLRTPALLSAHLGEWTFTEDEDGTTASSAHTVVLRPEAIPTVLGEEATVATARDFVRQALGRNSTATMELAREHAERLAAA